VKQSRVKRKKEKEGEAWPIPKAATIFEVVKGIEVKSKTSIHCFG
jgi:hypothetical protein